MCSDIIVALPFGRVNILFKIFGGIVMSFSERLVELRKSRGLTQKQVYEGVSMSMLGYQRYEYGEREPSFQKLIALADYFDVSLDYLVGRSDDPARH